MVEELHTCLLDETCDYTQTMKQEVTETWLAIKVARTVYKEVSLSSSFPQQGGKDSVFLMIKQHIQGVTCRTFKNCLNCNEIISSYSFNPYASITGVNGD